MEHYCTKCAQRSSLNPADRISLAILVIYHNDAGRIGELVKELIKVFDLYSTIAL